MYNFQSIHLKNPNEMEEFYRQVDKIDQRRGGKLNHQRN